MQTKHRTMSVLEAAKSGIDDVDCSCGRCGAPLGRYWLGRIGDSFPAMATEARRAYTAVRRGGALSQFRAVGPLRLPQRSRNRIGARTQPGIYWETYADVDYYRVKCSCGNNDKKRRADVANLDVTIRDDGIAVLVCW